MLVRAHAPDVIAVEQEVELRPGEIHYRVDPARPSEPRSLQALLPQHESASLPVQNPALDAPAIGEHEQLRREWVHRQRVLHQHRQPRDLLPEGHRLDAQPHLDSLVGRTNHGSRLAHSRTAAKALLSAWAETSTTTPLGRCTRNAAAPIAIRTGTNCGTGAVGSLSTTRRLSAECVVYSQLTDSPWACAYAFSVCPCLRQARRWSSQNCSRAVGREPGLRIARAIIGTLHRTMKRIPWHDPSSLRNYALLRALTLRRHRDEQSDNDRRARSSSEQEALYPRKLLIVDYAASRRTVTFRFILYSALTSPKSSADFFKIS